MRTPPALLVALGRAAALAGTAATLIATTVEHCLPAESATYAVETSCGPAGEITLSYSEDEPRGCAGCRGFLEAPGANAVGLPEQGEIRTNSTEEGFAGGAFGLVGPVALPGTDAPVVVHRECHFTPAVEGVLEVACTGDAPEAACGGTLTRLSPAGGAP
jgi:hypothetical protein